MYGIVSIMIITDIYEDLAVISGAVTVMLSGVVIGWCSPVSSSSSLLLCLCPVQCCPALHTAACSRLASPRLASLPACHVAAA